MVENVLLVGTSIQMVIEAKSVDMIVQEESLRPICWSRLIKNNRKTEMETTVYVIMSIFGNLAVRGKN